MATRQTRQRVRRAFLEAFREYGIVDTACRIAGMPRASVYYLQEHDETFALEFHQAEAIASERLEQEAWRRSVLGVTKEKPTYYLGQLVGSTVETDYSDGLLQFLLKARNPAKFRDRLDVTTTTNVKSYGGVDVDAV